MPSVKGHRPFIRSILLRDANTLAALHYDSFYQPRSPKPWPEDAFITLINSATTSGLLATVNQTPVGFILTQVLTDEAEILTFAVATAHQGRGIGAQLLSTLIAQLKAQGVGYLFLEVSVLNAAAIGLYEKYNFQQISERINYFPDLPNPTALVLKRQLS